MAHTPRILMLLENCSYPHDDRVRREARTLASAGYHVIVIAPASRSEPRREVLDGITVYRYPSPAERVGFIGYIWEYGYSMVAIFLLSLAVFVHEGFDVIHAHQPPDLFAFIAAFYKFFGKKYILDHHDLAPDLYEARFRGRARPVVTRVLAALERFSCRMADRVIATNESYKRVEMERGRVPEDKIAIIRNGPDLREVFKTHPDPSLRENGKTIIGYVGVMGTQDGVDNLLRAIQNLVFTLNRTNVKCILVGSGNALPDLKTLAVELGITEHVHFTGWVNGQDEVRRYLNAMDICAAPEPGDTYNQRSTAAKVMEYMAVGKPIVSFDLVEHRYSAQEAARYACPDDSLDFARQVAFLMDNPQECEQMGNFGLERIQNELAWQNQSSALVNLYNGLCNTENIKA
ncbi:MAG: glycosyltransferase family 4 protein [Chloroflexi bacterium]|nr:glycosyltransferase family 4 protein [Chloroflexota bacterium]